MDITSVSLNEFAQARAPEISSLLKVICSNKEDICKTASNCLDFQCMPVHLRRRSAGRKFYEHNKNKIAKTSKRKFIKERYKNRARINRRKKELTEFLRNRISTHVWHAKRFHMVELYNYRLPFYTTSKTYRPIHRAICSSVCLQVI
ncbi:Ribonucleases P/MRP protein subunit POP1 [Thelohanellus kitauei]|uniref:Ribonucleases P/MRP protein subunit POP1 n=1 Tax=Thelohanellus kitauei TaxID=669202 RepID=A0A0C2MEC4_THEKT|nr:Ribonucleases P/MRP protein subunit POP1 [Thelohanellus kitauei]